RRSTSVSSTRSSGSIGPAARAPGAGRRSLPRRGTGSGIALQRRLIVAEHVAHRAAHLAHRGAVLQRLPDPRQQVLGAAGGLAQLLEPRLHELLVAACLELLQARDLGVLAGLVDLEDV